MQIALDLSLCCSGENALLSLVLCHRLKEHGREGHLLGCAGWALWERCDMGHTAVTAAAASLRRCTQFAIGTAPNVLSNETNIKVFHRLRTNRTNYSFPFHTNENKENRKMT